MIRARQLVPGYWLARSPRNRRVLTVSYMDDGLLRVEYDHGDGGETAMEFLTPKQFVFIL